MSRSTIGLAGCLLVPGGFAGAAAPNVSLELLSNGQPSRTIDPFTAQTGAAFDVQFRLQTDVPVGGLQTQLLVSDPGPFEFADPVVIVGLPFNSSEFVSSGVSDGDGLDTLPFLGLFKSFGTYPANMFPSVVLTVSIRAEPLLAAGTYTFEPAPSSFWLSATGASVFTSRSPLTLIVEQEPVACEAINGYRLECVEVAGERGIKATVTSTLAVGTTLTFDNHGVQEVDQVDITGTASVTFSDVDGLRMIFLTDCPEFSATIFCDCDSADGDGDGDVDGGDIALFQACARGPAVPLAPGCEAKDFDMDGDVDQSDFALIQRCYSGASNPAAPDYDRDGDVDGDDIALFRPCAWGPAVPLTPGCEDRDLDTDGDVDQSDFAIVQRCYSGANNPADPDCAD